MSFWSPDGHRDDRIFLDRCYLSSPFPLDKISRERERERIGQMTREEKALRKGVRKGKVFFRSPDAVTGEQKLIRTNDRIRLALARKKIRPEVAEILQKEILDTLIPE